VGLQDTMTNNIEKYPLQAQTTKVAPEALDLFSNRPVTMWNFYVQRQVQEHNKEITLEAIPNYISITIHLKLSPSSKDTISRFSSVAADIIK
jgi:Holliday junction resolvase RusA-like endonuclease